jgi:hypothetical protein
MNTKLSRATDLIPLHGGSQLASAEVFAGKDLSNSFIDPVRFINAARPHSPSLDDDRRITVIVINTPVYAVLSPKARSEIDA